MQTITINNLVLKSDFYWEGLVLNKPHLADKLEEIKENNYFKKAKGNEQSIRDKIELSLIVLDMCFSDKAKWEILEVYSNVSILPIYACIESYITNGHLNEDFSLVVKMSMALAIVCEYYPKVVSEDIDKLVTALDIPNFKTVIEKFMSGFKVKMH